ncbi:MAG: hypothetical protein FWH59_01970 [Lentimicrobiaceae bacterium]|nr:hypothetical protein [Lentimicrobiaceae bacterium]
MNKGFFISSFLFFLLFCFPNLLFGQSNRLTNENGQLLWQYNQIVTVKEEVPNTLFVSFVFINGVNQTAISLRQELFYSQIEWLDSLDLQIEKEDRVEFITANIKPHQSIILKYKLKNKTVGKELWLEKSAILIMNEEFEVKKEIIPEQLVTRNP